MLEVRQGLRGGEAGAVGRGHVLRGLRVLSAYRVSVWGRQQVGLAGGWGPSWQC